MKKRIAKNVKEKKVFLGLQNIRAPKGAHKKRKLKGRGSGSGHGKTSTRGSKGQTSRSGRDFYLGFEGGQTPLIRRISKRGFTSKIPRKYQIVNLGSLKDLKAEKINPVLMKENGLIKNALLPVKILGNGELKNAVSIQAHSFSKQAADKIKKIGGSFEVLNV